MDETHSLASRTEVVNSFREWQHALIAEAQPRLGNIFYQPDTSLFVEFSGKLTDGVWEVVTFSAHDDFEPAIVKINLPKNVESTNGLSHVLLKKGETRRIVRQGRLQHNSQNPHNIIPAQFERVSECEPIYQTQQPGKPHRNWFEVCQLEQPANEIRKQTALFVTACQEVRNALAETGATRFPWIGDELILALEYYTRFGGSPPNQYSPLTAELSRLLRQLGTRMGRQIAANYRSPSSVYMKAMNFRRLDSQFRDFGVNGLKRGSKGEQAIWERYQHKIEELQTIAGKIRFAIDSSERFDISGQDEDEDPAEAVEGRVLVGLHRRKERSREIVNSKKKKALEDLKCLRCEGCEMTFIERYGTHGEDFIEVHHLFPVKDMEENHTTTLDELALLCANCHRMIHKRHPWLTIEQLKAIVVK